MKKIFAVLAALSITAALAWLIVPPPERARAQLSSAQTWVGAAGGTSTALTITVHSVVALNDLLGVPIRVIPGNTNTGPSTLQVNIDTGGNLGAIAINRPTSNLGLQALSGAEIQTSQMVEFTYDGTVFEITSPINMTPIGQTLEIRNNSGSAPLGTLLEDGSCYSTTTYAALYSVIGTTYNSYAPVACSGGQFAVPDSRGTSFAAADNQGTHGAASRITNSGSGCTATGIGYCGSQNQTLTLAQLPTGISASGNNSITLYPQGNPAFSFPVSSGTIADTTVSLGSGLSVPKDSNSSFGGVQNVSATVSISVTSNNTTGGSHPILQPILIGYRAIKY